MTDTPSPEPDAPSSDPPILSSRRRRRGGGGPGWGALLLLLGVIAAGVALWWALSRGTEEGLESGPIYRGDEGEETIIVGDTTGVRPMGTVDTEPFAELPSLDESDPWLRDRATDLSRDGRWLDWLAADGLVRRMVIAALNVAGGESPSEQLPFLQPSDTFRVVVEGDRTWADPANGRRYDGIVRSITSLDARATARFYRGIGPLIEAAWRPLGLVDREFDDVAREAVGVILAADVPTGRVEVVQDGVVWAYADPDLEALSPATKHLMRIGSDNLARLQDWLRTFAEASGLTP